MYFENETTQAESRQTQRHTIVFCDLHRVLVYIRKKSHILTDHCIRTKSNGTPVKFYITLRKSLIKALNKL
jgi:hypothetical protein